MIFDLFNVDLELNQEMFHYPVINYYRLLLASQES